MGCMSNQGFEVAKGAGPPAGRKGRQNVQYPMSNIQKGRFMGAVRMGWIGPGAAARLRKMNSVQDRRIAIDARWVFRELSGIGRYTLELLKQPENS